MYYKHEKFKINKIVNDPKKMYELRAIKARAILK